MNPLVEQMLNTKSRNDLELEILEQTFELNCDCQSRHVKVPSCAGVASYRISSCTKDTLQCADAVEHPVQGLRARQNRGNTCRDCDNLAVECWTIRPI